MSSQINLAKPVVLLTGFGPFGFHKENVSELAVRKIANSDLKSTLNIHLETHIIDVDYKKAKEFVLRKWKALSPKLVVHIGVSHLCKVLTLETRAENMCYTQDDITSYHPEDQCCLPGGESVLQSKLPLLSIRDEINSNSKLKLKCEVSDDPGKFLCSYTYYTSLSQNCSNSVFIHVPTLEFSPLEDISATLQEAISLLYKAVV